MSGKGFGKGQRNDDLLIESIVSHQDRAPYVTLRWGKESGKLTPDEAIAHAVGIICAATVATIDAQIVEWATTKLGRSIEESMVLLRLFRQKRESSKLPSTKLSIGGEHLRPDTVKYHGAQLIEMAFTTEAEAFLCGFLLEEMQLEPAMIDAIIQEFREMRGVETLWTPINIDAEADES